MREQIAVIGLGYVGLPLSLVLAKKFPNDGFDIDINKVEALKQGIDRTLEVQSEDLADSTLKITSDLTDIKSANFFVIAAPTPIDRHRRPDLNPLINASQIVGKCLQPGSVVVYESTVYPGVTQDICGPILAQVSGLRQSIDFKLGYSPERINPGDKEHTLEKIVKVVSAEDTQTLERVAGVYEAIIHTKLHSYVVHSFSPRPRVPASPRLSQLLCLNATAYQAGVYRAASIKTAEAAKVIENIQRDLNIALMNELALIFDRLGIRTADVLACASTKWNFLPFKPGLVGGHCIGVAPYYLTAIAEELGYHSEVILAGRRINDGMGIYLAQRLVKLLTTHGNMPLKDSRVGILGLTFKENVSDLRNSRVPDIVMELKQFGIEPLVHDPLANVSAAKREYGIELANWNEFYDLDALVLAVIHSYYLQMPTHQLLSCLKSRGILMDVKSALDPTQLPPQITYWSL